MGLYELHKLLFDVRHKPAVQEAFLANPAAVSGHYTLSEAELAALRTQDIYRLHKLGVGAYRLAPFAHLLGFPLMQLDLMLRAGAAAAQEWESSSCPGV
jgi:Aromatic-ring-opening dioxygenase LigAB, LigA subunit